MLMYIIKRTEISKSRDKTGFEIILRSGAARWFRQKCGRHVRTAAQVYRCVTSQLAPPASMTSQRAVSSAVPHSAFPPHHSPLQAGSAVSLITEM